MVEDAAENMELSCRLLRGALLYFERHYGRQHLESALARSDVGCLPEDLSDVAKSVSLALGERVLDALALESRDPVFAFQAGLANASPEALGFLFHVLRALASPQFAYRTIIDLTPAWNRIGTFVIEELSATRCVVTYCSRLPEQSPNSCQFRQGQLAGLPQVFALPPAQVAEHQCQIQGAPCCRYELRWQAHSSPVLRGAIGGLAGALAGVLLLSRAAGYPLAATLGLVVGSAVSLALACRSRSRADRELRATRDVALLRSLRAPQEGEEQMPGVPPGSKAVKRLGGEIQACPEPGKSTPVLLPPAPDASPAVPPPARAVTAPAPPGGRRKVLVVDDEPMLGRAIARLLGVRHDVTTCTDARDALQKVRGGERFDRILSDLMMPNLSGMDLFREIQSIDPAQADRMIFLTGGAFTPEAEVFLRSIPNPSCTKPVDGAVLLRLVEAGDDRDDPARTRAPLEPLGD